MAYCRYLAANLKFPIVTSYWEKSGAFTSKKISVSITRLEAPVEEEFDEECGLYWHCRYQRRRDRDPA